MRRLEELVGIGVQASSSTAGVCKRCSEQAGLEEEVQVCVCGVLVCV